MDSDGKGNAHGRLPILRLRGRGTRSSDRLSHGWHLRSFLFFGGITSWGVAALGTSVLSSPQAVAGDREC